MSRPPVEVRKAGVGDLDDLLLLWSQSREELSRNLRSLGALPADHLRPRLRETLAAGEPPVLIARYEAEPAGYALLRIAPALAVDPAALHIDHLFVTPSLRRRGVARALLVAATAIAERNGAEQILAGAPPSARDTHRFLARLGFSPLVVRRVTPTAALRRRLAGEGQRRVLEDLLSRRRSRRARATRAAEWTGGWSGGSGSEGNSGAGRQSPEPAPAGTAGQAVIADCRVRKIDLGRVEAGPWPAFVPGEAPERASAAPGVPAPADPAEAAVRRTRVRHAGREDAVGGGA